MLRAAHTLVILALLAGRASAQVESGPKPGEAARAFEVYAATGEQADKVVDYVADRAAKPTVYVFIKPTAWDRPMARFLKVLDGRIADGVEGAADASAVAVWLAEDPEKSKEYLPRAQESIKLGRTDLTVYEGGTEGPDGWDLNDGARLTAVVVRDGKVVKAFGFTSLNETDVAGVAAALAGP